MAFPIPSHLPRGGNAQSKSSQIISKISDTTATSLTADLAASWLQDLSNAITETHHQIHDRIEERRPDFDRQFEAAVSLQTRVQNLSDRIEELQGTLYDTQTGLIPNITRTLTAQKALAQETCDVQVTYGALSYLARCKEQYAKLKALADAGRMPEAVEGCATLGKVLDDVPNSLKGANVRRFRILNDSVNEQLSQAYADSLVFSYPSSLHASFTINSPVKVSKTTNTLTLEPILASLHPATLSEHLTSLRRDLITRFVEPVCRSQSEIAVEDHNQHFHVLTLSPSANSSSPLTSLRTLVSFLSQNFLLYLPPSHETVFTTSLYAPLTSLILSQLIQPHLPSKTTEIPSFLELVDDAVRYESELKDRGIASGEANDIAHWADKAATHYEQRRRETLISKAKDIIQATGLDGKIRVDAPPTPTAHSIPLPEPHSSSDENADNTAWDFQEDPITEQEANMEPEADDWGFNEESGEPKEDEGLEADADGWGWGDDEDDSVEAEAPPPPPPQVHPAERSSAQPNTPIAIAPKAATRLEKLSSKGKSASSTPLQSPAPPQSPVPSHPVQAAKSSSSSIRPELKKAEKVKYSVTHRATSILELVEAAIREGETLRRSQAFPVSTSSDNLPGMLIMQTGPLILDLLRAIYPVGHGQATSATKKSMQWACDCRFLSLESTRIANALDEHALKTRIEDVANQLHFLWEVTFDDVIVREEEKVDAILDKAHGFGEISNDRRQEQVQEAVEEVLREIRSTAYEWKSVLARTDYSIATGAVVNAALTRITRDVLALPDITEMESERLAEATRTLESLQNLFVGADGESEIGIYVSSWFRFSYLGELLVASIADISYLFEQGMLVDYETDELVRLLRALFSETPLRANTIAKFQRGHPVMRES
ncbi:hypothetical protein SISNIDRAFT_484577 [Sistotremastrum niveocremeum HHB9708]|uniref:Retrograde transport protein Dsl1 C-terminal domain-containing protein n=2 Tax=Sistotremastraceae TaxID=3402574 RepID=A0A164VPU6_9AGAM|nr:hypothetical protein SISNIDRAFT_484577 [Sistotremastrum niveocremeum HHB9708]KZT37931.1 hypothetical protein SISSUDRAFT_1062410 [Sistotremastrum suecicum HHB10207 ss-3]